MYHRRGSVVGADRSTSNSSRFMQRCGCATDNIVGFHWKDHISDELPKEGSGGEGEGSWEEQNIAYLPHALYHKLASGSPTSAIPTVLHQRIPDQQFWETLPKKGDGAQIQKTLGNVQTGPFWDSHNPYSCGNISLNSLIWYVTAYITLGFHVPSYFSSKKHSWALLN